MPIPSSENELHISRRTSREMGMPSVEPPQIEQACARAALCESINRMRKGWREVNHCLKNHQPKENHYSPSIHLKKRQRNSEGKDSLYSDSILPPHKIMCRNCRLNLYSRGNRTYPHKYGGVKKNKNRSRADKLIDEIFLLAQQILRVYKPEHTQHHYKMSYMLHLVQSYRDEKDKKAMENLVIEDMMREYTTLLD